VADLFGSGKLGQKLLAIRAVKNQAVRAEGFTLAELDDTLVNLNGG